MKVTKQTIFVGVAGLAVGAVAVLGIRFAAYSPERVHYHANFNVYVNGQREAFASPFYYEEEAGGSCTTDTAITPGKRAHMHDNIGDVVHVEDHAVTWGQFFQNLGWTVNDTLVQTRDKVYLADAAHPITFMINNHLVQNISTEVINDNDRLLVDFGTTDDAVLQKEYQAVPATAAQYDQGKDPAACMSNAKPTMSERMRHLF